jgi:hypothetical protein
MPKKKARMTTTFTKFLRLLDASMVVQGRNILLFVDILAAYRQDTVICLWTYVLLIGKIPSFVVCGHVLLISKIPSFLNDKNYCTIHHNSKV